MQKQKGTIILSMARSGTNWLSSISKSTGTMGNSGEWIAINDHAKSLNKGTPDRFIANIIKHASTENGHFSIKIFPHHLHQVRDRYGIDFIRECRRLYDLKILFLEREDTLAQSISFLKASQTGRWRFNSQTGRTHNGAQPEYDFLQLAQIYFHIQRGYAFWRSYLAINHMPFEAFRYESLTEDPSPWLKAIADHLEVPMPESMASPLKIQRDNISENWKALFEDDIKAKGLPPKTFDPPMPDTSVRAALKMLFGVKSQISRYGWHN